MPTIENDNADDEEEKEMKGINMDNFRSLITSEPPKRDFNSSSLPRVMAEKTAF